MGAVLHRSTLTTAQLIVQPEIAQDTVGCPARRATTGRSARKASESHDAGYADIIPPPDAPAPPKLKTRYYGTKRIEAKRSVLKFGEIANEIIQRLEADSDYVEITIEINSQREAGFDDATVRTISENSRTLNFDDHGFED